MLVLGEPNNGAGEGQDCVHIYPSVLALDDEECDDVKYGLCEVKVYDC